MVRERALKTVLVVVGLLFTAAVIPLTMFSRENLRCRQPECRRLSPFVS